MSQLHKIFTVSKSFLIDLAVIIILTLGIISVFDNAIGDLSSSIIVNFDDMSQAGINILIIFSFISMIYTTICILSKYSVGCFFAEKRMGDLARRRFAAFIVDTFFIIFVTVFLNLLLQDSLSYDGFILLLYIISLYIIIAELAKGKTIGYKLFSLSVHNIPASLRERFFRATIKCLLSIVLPYIICLICGIKEPLAICMDIGFVNMVVYFFSLIIGKQFFWDRVFRVEICFEEIQNHKKRLISTLISLMLIAGCVLCVRYVNNRRNPTGDVFWGFHYPYDFPRYTNQQSIQPYYDFLAQQEKSAESYVLELFQQYDIVVLMEPYHGETTFWDFVGNIVCDTFFIRHVGHLFTEYGSATHQDKVDQYLKTTFANDTVLEQQTALIMDYMSGGFYYFLKRINQQNAVLPDNLKIQEHFTDCIDWDYFPSSSMADVRYADRDSLMADVVIRWYDERKKSGCPHKLLLVTNTRHAFGYAGGMARMKALNHRHLTIGNEAQYIWAKYPQKTATVLCPCLNKSRMWFFPIYQDINHGRWTAAFAANGNKSVGFDLDNSPFGNDQFELYPLKGARTPLRFADFFIGMVFYKPYSELQFSSYPYQKYAIREEAKSKGITDTVRINELLSYHSSYFTHNQCKELHQSLSRGNYLPLMVFLFFALLSALCVVVDFFTTLTECKQEL